MIVQEGTLASSSARKSQREVDGSPDKNITMQTQLQPKSELSTPIDEDFVTITELLSHRAKECPHLEIVGVPDAGFNIKKYTFGQLDAASSRLARHYANTGLIPTRAIGDCTTRSVIGLLAPSGYDYAVQTLAIIKLGHAALFLSVNIPAEAIAHLMNLTDCRHIVAHSSLQALATDSADSMCRLGLGSPQVIQLSSFEIYGEADQTNEKTWDMMIATNDLAALPAFIVHSSGSTGLPKPIAVTHKASCYNIRIHFDLEAFTTLPLFHNHGHSCFYRALQSKKIIYLYPTDLPLTTSNILNTLAETRDVKGFFVVPFVLKLLAETPEGLAVLRKFQLVTYGGAACPDELGNNLVNEGVRLAGHYGCTECGQLMTSFRDFETDKAWNYVRSKTPSAKTVARYLHFNEQHDGSLELVVKPGWPGKVMENLPDGSYTTKDLFVRHPTIPDAYKFVGRLDDTLVLYTGEKVNPVPMELLMKGSSVHVAECIVFGEGRSHTGMLVFPTELAKDMDAASMYKAIKSHLESTNSKAPPYAAVAPEMIVFLPFGTTYPAADKGSFIRPKVYKKFQEVIDSTYARFEAGDLHPGGVTKAKLTLHGIEMKDFVIKAFQQVVGDRAASLGPTQDFFAFGINSLQTARLRLLFQRDLQLNGKKLPMNVVFEHPTINDLSGFLEKTQSGQLYDAKERDSQQLSLMNTYLEKYSNFPFPDRPDDGSLPAKEVVVLTGATGSLGAHLLDRLLRRPDVRCIYCLVRASSEEEAQERVKQSLQQRALPALTASTAPRVKCLPARPGSTSLGLTSSVFADIAATVTLVIHNAWAVNFNMGVESFEQEHIQAAYNLLTLAITSGAGRPARFFFSSSVSAAARVPPPTVEEQTYADPETAQPMGYARSKWVVEQMCKRASTQSRVRAEVLRIGQMVGDSHAGVWNETEAISLMIKSAKTLGCAPELEEKLSWLPVDYAAAAIDQLMFSQASTDTATERVWHVLNPQTTNWGEVYEGLRSAGLSFETVPTATWLEALRTSTADVRRNPTFKLLDFFVTKYGSSSPDKPRARLETVQTAKAAPALTEVPEMSHLVTRFARTWQKSGFL